RQEEAGGPAGSSGQCARRGRTGVGSAGLAAGDDHGTEQLLFESGGRFAVCGSGGVLESGFGFEKDEVGRAPRVLLTVPRPCENSSLKIVSTGIYYALALGAAGALVFWLAGPWFAAPMALLALFCLYFFRDPDREIPSGPVAVSPADGK